MAVKFYDIIYKEMSEHAPSWETQQIEKIINSDGKTVSQLEFIWLKDPKIPLIVYTEGGYDGFGNFLPSFKNGMGHIRKWIETNIDDQEDVHIFYDKSRFYILFESKEAVVAYKLSFCGDDEHDLTWVEMTTLFD